MARTVDEVTLKVGVEGTGQLDQLNNALTKTAQNTKETSDQLKAFNVRNVAYQVQDLAVQLSMGTNAFVAIGQQLPQLLSGFGVAGAVIGAVAAVAIPLLQKGLEMVGYDFRNLNQRITDLNAANQDFIKAQQANLASVQGLTAGYGGLASASKEFFQVQQDLTKTRALFELGTAVVELQSNLKTLAPPIDRIRDSLGIFSAPVEGIARLEAAFKRWQLGLTAKEAEELGNKIRAIDPNNPEQVVTQITDLLQFLKETGVSADKIKNIMEQVVNPALKIANAGLDLKKNIKAAGEEASALQVALLELQSKYLPDINAAKRNFDQIKAIQLEGQLKIAEFERQAKEKTDKDAVNRSKEIAAFRLRTEQDVADKIADVKKAQDETARSSLLTAEAKGRQLELETKILGFNKDGKMAALDSYQLQVDITRATAEYEEQLKAIDEQIRKNLITQTQGEILRKQAADNRIKAEEAAVAKLNDRAEAYVRAQELSVALEKDKLALTEASADQSDRIRKLAQDGLAVEQERAKQLIGIAQIQDPALRAAKERELNDVLDKRLELLMANDGINQRIAASFETGWRRAYNNYVESSRNAFETARGLFEKTTKGMEDLIVNFAKTGKFEFKNFLISITEEILRSNVKRLIANVFSMSPTEGGGNNSSIVGSLFQKLLGFADGGMIPNNGPVIVGERGPELLLNAGGSQVIPNSALSGGTYVTYNINAVDAASFKSMVARDPAFIHAVATQGSKMLPNRR